MAEKTNHLSIPSSGGFGLYNRYKYWNTSSRNASGRLVLRAQPCWIQITTLVGRETNSTDTGWIDYASRDVRSGYKFADDGGLKLDQNTGPVWDSVYNAAYSRFRGKLYKGGASLGVTLAGIRQSRDMIAARMEKLARASTDLVGRTSRNPRVYKDWNDVSRARASDILEGEFGWLPLVQDVHSFLTTAIDTPASPFIRASQHVPVAGTSRYKDGSNRFTASVYGKVRCTIAAQAVISNPNLWLANRLGLINPATVVWDLVPWSFVVNMFANINGILNSYTDFMGLDLRDLNVTRGYTLVWDNHVTRDADPRYLNQQVVIRRTSRSVGGSLPRPSLQFQLPKGNWELALIAGALGVQNMSKISRLMTLPRKLRALSLKETS